MKLMELKIEKVVDLNMVLKKHNNKFLLTNNLIYSNLIIFIIQKLKKQGKQKISENLLKNYFLLLKNNKFNFFEILLEKNLNKIKSPVILYLKKFKGSTYKIPYRLNLKKSLSKSIKLLKNLNIYNINFSKIIYIEFINILNNKGFLLSNKLIFIKQALYLRVFF
uniref:30S ribosomal protein S7 n=1 Tax=Nephromyces sp. ex Molgula occidentalis TaxID=2544991 RepID=A0A5C1H8G5_9APIC|nr:30S ribosomal protein S7 [Nephromyces sp. ex Molgula occidentalis]